MSEGEITCFEESLPEEVTNTFGKADDEIADLNMLLSKIDSSSAPNINGGEVDSFNGYDFVNEMAPQFPEISINTEALGDMSYINTDEVEKAFNRIVSEIRNISCHKVGNVIQLLRPIETIQIKLANLGVDKEEAEFISLNPKIFEIREDEKKVDTKTILTSPNLILAEYLKLRLKTTFDHMEEIWNGIFNNDKLATETLNKFSKGIIDYEEFSKQISHLPSIKICENEENDPFSVIDL